MGEARVTLDAEVSAASVASDSGYVYAENPYENIFQRLRSIVSRGEAALDIALRSPEASAMLAVLYSPNPLLRERDFPGQGHTAKNAPVSRKLARTYKPEQTAAMDAAGLVHEAHESIVQWYAFFNGGAAEFLEPGGHESANDWKRIANRLQLFPGKLLTQFYNVQAKKYAMQGMHSGQIRDTVQSQMVMLPYTLLSVAWRALPGESSELKLRRFRKLIGLADDLRYLEATPFESNAAKNAFARASTLLVRMNLLQPGMNYEESVRILVGHCMATRITDNLAFASSNDALYEEAAQFTRDIARSLDVDAKSLRKSLDEFKSWFQPAVVEDHIQAALQGSKHGVPTRLKLHDLLQTIFANRSAFLIDLQCQIQSRALLDGVLDGELMPDSLSEIVGLAHEMPLKQLAVRVEEVEELLQQWEVEWVIAPSHVGQRGPRETEPPKSSMPKTVSAETSQLDVDIDEERYEWLRRYVLMWGRGAIVRSKIPNLPPHRQYRLALLPQTMPNGETVWHGVADNRELRKHRLLLWRAEAGIDKYGRVRREWDRVFRMHKDEMKRVGVFVLNHTPTMRDRVIDLLYASPDSIPRYERFGEIALRHLIEKQVLGS